MSDIAMADSLIAQLRRVGWRDQSRLATAAVTQSKRNKIVCLATQCASDGNGDGLHHPLQIALLKIIFAEEGVTNAVGRILHLCFLNHLGCLDQLALNAFCHKAVFYWYGTRIAAKKLDSRPQLRLRPSVWCPTGRSGMVYQPSDEFRNRVRSLLCSNVFCNLRRADLQHCNASCG